MRALEPEVVDVIWAAVEPMLPERPVRDLGRGHRPRIPDRLCFWGILVRLATGWSWQSAEALLGWQVSDTTLRSRRDEWIAAGVFERIAAEAIAAYDRIVGLDLDDVCIDGVGAKLCSRRSASCLLVAAERVSSVYGTRWVDSRNASGPKLQVSGMRERLRLAAACLRRD